MCTHSRAHMHAFLHIHTLTYTNTLLIDSIERILLANKYNQHNRECVNVCVNACVYGIQNNGTTLPLKHALLVHAIQ